MMAAYDLIDVYCEIIVARLPIIESQKYADDLDSFVFFFAYEFRVSLALLSSSRYLGVNFKSELNLQVSK